LIYQPELAFWSTRRLLKKFVLSSWNNARLS